MKNGTKVSACAYADDITPMSSSPQGMQDQLNLIDSFMKMWDMSMSPAKSSIIINRRKHQNDFPDFEFKLDDTPIEQITEAHELTRYLGVHWSLDGKYTSGKDV